MLWERSLFGFVCRINWTKGIYTLRDNLYWKEGRKSLKRSFYHED